MASFENFIPSSSRKSARLEVKILRDWKERKKLMALRMSETTSSWEWFQLEGNNDAVDRVRGICCARRLPPNFGGPRSIMDISIFHILRSSVSLERASRKRERKRGSEGDRRKLEWFSNRFPFQVRTSTRRQGLSNSQPPGLSFRKLSFQMFAYRLWTRATATFIPVYLSLRRIEIDRARSPIVFNRFLVTHRSIVFLFSKKNSPILYIPRWSFSSSTRV